MSVCLKQWRVRGNLELAPFVKRSTNIDSIATGNNKSNGRHPELQAESKPFKFRP